jgi:hypothetical protein
MPGLFLSWSKQSTAKAGVSPSHVPRAEPARLVARQIIAWRLSGDTDRRIRHPRLSTYRRNGVFLIHRSRHAVLDPVRPLDD